jgi:hypothetical protein
MRSYRLISATAIILAVSMLAACGGGGGGGTTPNIPTPTSTPAGPPPGSPTPHPSPSGSSTPIASPTPIPTSSPLSTPTPGATPTPVTTPVPTPANTPTPSASATPNRTLGVTTGFGQVNGDDTMFPDSIGEEPNDGDYPNGGHGPLNDTKGPDGVPCLAQMYTGQVAPDGPGYHVHAFIGMYLNGKEVALPDGLGFADPLGDGTFNGVPNWTQYATKCYYEMHSHDASGTIHIETFTAPPGNQFGTVYTLGDFLAVWGIPVGPSNWGPLNGTVTIYTSGAVARGGPGTGGYVFSNTYSLYCRACDANTIGAIPLYSHEVIWVLVGSGNLEGSALPNVDFFTEW